MVRLKPMTRIIGGLAGSLQLTSPAKSTRPTSDRIRESIFNRLESQAALGNARVLDLFAGTGALGLEALSRGAVSLQMVENNRQAYSVCQRNARSVTDALTRQEEEVAWQISPLDSGAFAGTGGPYDLVFIDPPYEYANASLESLLGKLKPTLSKEALVIVERSSRTDEPALPQGYTLESRKDYGDTSVYWLELASD